MADSPVQYVRVKAQVDMFAPAARAYGNLAIVGTADGDADFDTPEVVATPAEARERFPGPLGDAIRTALQQTPGPSLVYGIRVAERPSAPEREPSPDEEPAPEAGEPALDWAAALDAAASVDVQFVVLAGTELDADTAGAAGAIALLKEHVVATSETGADGRERMGVAMLERGSTDTSMVGQVASERMIYVAHKSSGDAAAAVAGTIAGYQPHVSPLLKPVSISSDPFTARELVAINGSEDETTGPTGKGVVWLTHPALIPGQGLYLGEAYTGGGDPNMKFIDVVRTVDDVKFRLKARLIGTIGTLRITRSGLRSLIAQLEAVLDPLVQREVIDGYDVVIPLIALLDKDPASRTESEQQRIDDAQAKRLVEVLVAVDYAGAIHRIALNLKFS
jgi:hypothetical protein